MLVTEYNNTLGGLHTISSEVCSWDARTVYHLKGNQHEKPWETNEEQIYDQLNRCRKDDDVERVFKNSIPLYNKNSQ